MKILFATSEAYPFAMSGGLADVAGALPKALHKRLVGCRVVMPLYNAEAMKPELKEKLKFITAITVPVSWRRQYCGIFEAHMNGVIYYLLDNQYYFKRDYMYGHYDDAERFAFFSRAVLEMLPHINFWPDVIHCNDWHTAMVPVYKSTLYGGRYEYDKIKTLFTIHNVQYQGKYGEEILGDVLGVPKEAANLLEYDGCINLMKGAVECADAVNTVSPTYANELMDEWYAHGMHGILRERSFKLSGIVNGIDTQVYDPETDPDIFKNYNAETLDDKAENKRKLQELMGLPQKADTPLVGIVTRLVSHKGIDLIKYVFESVVAEDVQFVILGSGDWVFENFFSEMAAKYPEKVALKLGFVPHLAHKIYAGADMFLMPSKSEPCGLAQMVALRYGTIPIVRETGGLKDTVIDSGDGKGNGFTFCDYNAHEMENAIRRALAGYRDKTGWRILSTRAMECDNSWQASAGEYIKLYKKITGIKR
ncbi:MAG: glycogen synthase GlgA [Clostridia bacterium]|nr:glycogen synthase GlgA [Clostridia bacterium]